MTKNLLKTRSEESTFQNFKNEDNSPKVCVIKPIYILHISFSEAKMPLQRVDIVRYFNISLSLYTLFNIKALED